MLMNGYSPTRLKAGGTHPEGREALIIVTVDDPAALKMSVSSLGGKLSGEQSDGFH